MTNEDMWMNILSGAAKTLFTITPGIFEELREARSRKRSEKKVPKLPETPAILANPSNPLVKDEATLIKILEKSTGLAHYEGEVDRIETLQELIQNERRNLNDYQIEQNRPGLSIEQRVAARQAIEDGKRKIAEWVVELQDLLEKISGHLISVRPDTAD